MKSPMFASIRKYNNVPAMTDELVKRHNEIQSVLQPVPGFRSYYLVKTTDGAVSLTLCDDRAGVDESNRVAAGWLKDKLPTFATHAPEITIGEVRIQIEPELAKVAK